MHTCAARFDDVMTDAVCGNSVMSNPQDLYSRAADMKRVLADCQDPVIRHILELIAAEMCDIVDVPRSEACWQSIALHARAAAQVFDERDRRRKAALETSPGDQYTLHPAKDELYEGVFLNGGVPPHGEDESESEGPGQGDGGRPEGDTSGTAAPLASA